MDRTGPGTLLAGRYRLQEQVSADPVTTLWRAEDLTLERPVSVRVLSATHAKVQTTLDSARRAALVDDVRLQRVIGVGVEAGSGYVVLEWITGQDAASLAGKVSEPEALRIVREAAEALRTAASRQLHHGRLGPRQVVRASDGRVRVVGTGIDVAAVGQASPAAAASPESRDVRDLGAVLYALLTGLWPFGVTEGLLAAPTEKGRPVSPRELRADVTERIDLLLTEVLGGSGPASLDGLVQALRGPEADGVTAVAGGAAAVAGVAHPAADTGDTGDTDVLTPVRPEQVGPAPAAASGGRPGQAAAAADRAPLAGATPAGATPGGVAAGGVAAGGVAAGGVAAGGVAAGAAAAGGVTAGGVTPGALPAGAGAGSAGPAGAGAAGAAGTGAAGAAGAGAGAAGAAGGVASGAAAGGGSALAAAGAAAGAAAAAARGLPPTGGATAAGQPGAGVPEGVATTPYPVRTGSTSGPGAAGPPSRTRTASYPAAAASAGYSTRAPAWEEEDDGWDLLPVGEQAWDDQGWDAARVDDGRQPWDDEPWGDQRYADPSGDDPRATEAVLPAGRAARGKGRPAGAGTGVAVVLVMGAFVVATLVWALDRVQSTDETVAAPGPVATVTVQPSVEPSVVAPAPPPPPDAPTLVSPAGVQALDPQGDGEENDQDAPRAIDNDPATSWQTQRYNSQDFGRLKTGLGLAFDLGAPADVQSITITAPGAGGTYEVRAATGPAYDGSTVIATGQTGDAPSVLAPETPVTTQFVVVWFTALPQLDGDFRAAVSEVQVQVP